MGRLTEVGRRGSAGDGEAGPRRFLPLVVMGAVLAAVLWFVVFSRSLFDDWGHLAVPFVAVHLAGTAVLTAAAMITWVRRPSSHIGPLLLAAAFANHLAGLQYFPAEAAFPSGWSVGEVANAVGGLPIVLFFHAALTYPSGRFPGPIERVVVWSAYALVLGFGWLLPTPSYRWMAWPGLVVMALALGLGLTRAIKASPAARRVIGPVPVLVLVFTFVGAAVAAVWGLENHSEQTLRVTHLGQALISPLVGLAFMVSLVQTRIARAAVGDLLLRLQRRPGPEGLVEALREALRDRSFDVAFWLPNRGAYVDAAGRAFSEVGEARAGRSSTPVEGPDGTPVALLLHDPAFDTEPQLVEAVVAAVHLAVENARLQAELAVQLHEVEVSRARIVTAADAERRRVERNLHDGAQQHFVAVAALVQAAEQESEAPEVRELLASAAETLRDGLRELRELARGLHPVVLTRFGLAGGIESLAERSRLPVTVARVPRDRFGAAVELTAYVVVAEALTNAVKHAAATAVTVSIRYRSGWLDLEVTDDGAGGAELTDGGGLEGLRDRVAALGGELAVLSPPTAGTSVRARLPAEVLPCPAEPDADADPGADLAPGSEADPGPAPDPVPAEASRG